MTIRITSITTDFGEKVILTQFAGPEDVGRERRCLQVGDHLRLSARDAQQLSDEIDWWLGELRRCDGST